MTDLRRCVIQRSDGAWYAERNPDGTTGWVSDRPGRQEFEDAREAWKVFQQLQQSGVKAMLFAVVKE